jgi:SynChlorMet cassette radical SAM/SPASM protein ScmF
MIDPGVPELRHIYLYPSRGCNLSCRHCWVSCAAEWPGFRTRPRQRDELSAGEFLDIASEAKALGLKYIKLTGGEPLIRDDIADLYTGLIEQGFGVSIETNGTIHSADMIDSLAQDPPLQVAVSLDSADPERHDRIRGVPGSWERAVRFIRLLTSMEIRSQTIMTVSACETDEVREMVTLLNGLGVHTLKINTIAPMGRGERVAPDRRDIAEQIEFAKQVHAMFGPAVSVNIPPAFVPLARLPGSSQCSIRNLIGVLPDGRASLCGMGLTMPELVAGDLREDSLVRLWRSSPLLRQLRAEVPSGLEGVCSVCMHRAHCLGHCVMENYMRKGRLTASNEFCERTYQIGLFPQTRLGAPDEDL